MFRVEQDQCYYRLTSQSSRSLLLFLFVVCLLSCMEASIYTVLQFSAFHLQDDCRDVTSDCIQGWKQSQGSQAEVLLLTCITYHSNVSKSTWVDNCPSKKTFGSSKQTFLTLNIFLPHEVNYLWLNFHYILYKGNHKVLRSVVYFFVLNVCFVCVSALWVKARLRQLYPDEWGLNNNSSKLMLNVRFGSYTTHAR